MRTSWAVLVAILLACPAGPAIADARGNDDVPPQCQEAPRNLDRRGRADLRAFESFLIRAMLVEKSPLLNTGDLHRLVREYPDALLALIFPVPVKLPRSPFAVRYFDDTWAIQAGSRTVFAVSLADVKMVGAGKRRGLTLRYRAGPEGSPPNGVVWTWGLSGEYCLVPAADGGWTAHPIGSAASAVR